MTSLELLSNRAMGLHQQGDLVQAEQLYRQVLGQDPAHFNANYLLGVMRAQQGQHAEALQLVGAALKADPNAIPALANHGRLLQMMGRFTEALASFDRLIALQPDHGGAHNNRGVTLQSLGRSEDALASFDRALALAPGNAGAWNNRGLLLQDQRRFEEALASFDRALALKPEDAEIWNNRGTALEGLRRVDEALSCFDRALSLAPGHARALFNRGSALCELGRTAEGFAAFTQYAEAGFRAGDVIRSVVPHKLQHDREQRDYIAGGAAPAHAPAMDDVFLLADGERLPGPAVNPANDIDAISRRWREATPQIVVVDNLLTPQALEKLRHFCWGSSVWRKVYDQGYLGALPESGLACPLLAQIADELRQVFPALCGEHALHYLWGFKFDSKLTGVKVHGDKAAVNVNFWITPDDANLDPDSGGLIVWDKAAPLDWDFFKYNAEEKKIRDFLAQSGARPTTIAYRCNRAVIFDSDLFHETDKIDFKDGYTDRRINITLLYGRRSAENL